jgi:mRNA interferase MazF
MKSGTSIEQRDIILVPFPYSDLTGSKRRPALVVSSDAFNEREIDVICCAITSKSARDPKAIVITNVDVEPAFLIVESKVKPSKLFTVSKTIVYKKLGKLKVNRFNEVVSSLYAIMPKA